MWEARAESDCSGLDSGRVGSVGIYHKGGRREGGENILGEKRRIAWQYGREERRLSIRPVKVDAGGVKAKFGLSLV